MPAVKSYNVEQIRRDFPILQRKVNGKQFVYLDNAATAQKPRIVMDTMTSMMAEWNANIHRGVYYISERATAMYENARVKIAKFINSTPEETIYTRSTTESINTIAYSYGLKFLKPGDEIIITEMEHHSNIVPWQIIAARTGAVVKAARITDSGMIDVEHLKSLISGKTKIVAFTAQSNVLGTVTPVAEICTIAEKAGAISVVDASQFVCHHRVDVKKWNCSFAAFSAHKLFGPTGIGILYGKKALLEKMDPFLGGGDMIKQVHLDRFTCNDLPYKFEAGTMPFAEAVSFGAAIDYLNSLGLDEIEEYETALFRYAYDKLSKLEAVTIYGPGPSQRSSILSFNVGNLHPHDVATVLDTQGVAIRAGHHCAQPLMRRLNVMAVARISLAFYNTKEEIDIACEALIGAKDFFSIADGGSAGDGNGK